MEMGMISIIQFQKVKEKEEARMNKKEDHLDVILVGNLIFLNQR